MAVSFRHQGCHQSPPSVFNVNIDLYVSQMRKLEKGWCSIRLVVRPMQVWAALKPLFPETLDKSWTHRCVFPSTGRSIVLFIQRDNMIFEWKFKWCMDLLFFFLAADHIQTRIWDLFDVCVCVCVSVCVLECVFQSIRLPGRRSMCSGICVFLA